MQINKLKFYLILAGAFLFQFTVHGSPEAEILFKTGFNYYEQEQYSLAIPSLENAVELEPENAQYHYVLAKSYGREAEKSNWFKAIKLAKKTLNHLEIAATLDSENIEILDDLKDFYRDAPGFLGGNAKKADKIEALIERLSQKNKHLPGTTAEFE